MGSFPIIPLGLAVIGCVVVYQFLRVFQEMKGCWRWPKAPATIVQSDAEMRTRTNAGRAKRMVYPKIVYEYRVGGKTYRSERLYFGPEIGGSSAVRWARRYPVGREIAIRYKPENPAEAVLIRTAPALLFLLAVAALVAVLFMSHRVTFPFRNFAPDFYKSNLR